MMLESYNYYTIQNVRGRGSDESSTGYLHIPGASMKRAEITQWDMDNSGVKFTDHFEFMLIAADGEAADLANDAASAASRRYFIVNRRSGLNLMVESFDDKVALVQAEWPPTEKLTDTSNKTMTVIQEPMAQFVLEPVDSDTYTYKIRSEFSGAYLVVEVPKDKSATDNGNPVKARNEFLLDESAEDDQTKFVLKFVERAPVEEKPSRNEDLTKLRKLPRMTDISTGLPDATDPLLVDFDELPYFRVNDPPLPRHRQIELSPCYTLRQYRLWEKLYDRELDGVVERESTETIRLGMTQVDVQSVRAALATSVEATASASYSGFGVKAGVSVTAKLQAETEYAAERTKQNSEERTTEDRLTYPSIGSPYRIVKWRPIDRFELRRTDDVLLSRWEVVREDEEVIDVFPQTASARKSPGRRKVNRPEAATSGAAVGR